MNTPRLLPAALAVLAAGSAANAGAIMRRHDRDDAKYRELGEKYDCTVVIAGGTGTLVAPRWILTAAHVAQNVSALDRVVHFGEETRTIEKVFTHPTWQGRMGSPEEVYDLALLRLDAPVRSVEPVAIYEGEDEVGMTIVFVGRGMTGDGAAGIDEHDDGRLRAARNVVDSIAYDHWLVFDFDAPPDALDLEGISGPGDSGGPAIAEIDGRLYVVGVSSSNDAHGGKPCTYGSNEYYPRVSAAADWLDDTMREQLDTPADETIEISDVSGGAWPAGRGPACARALFEAFNAADAEAIAAFERMYRGEQDPRGRSVEERVERWLSIHDDWGPQTPQRLAQPSPDRTQLQTKGKDGRQRVWTFEFDDSEPMMLLGVAIGG
ncbi:MAG: trypsin-like serine protease [Phycisphaerales bacterium]